ncbi:MAG: hypothetical protein ACK54C_17955 [Betaproteobacteria bacterium]
MSAAEGCVAAHPRRAQCHGALALALAPDARVFDRRTQVLEQRAQPAEALRHDENARSLPSALSKTITTDRRTDRGAAASSQSDAKRKVWTQPFRLPWRELGGKTQ